MLLAAGAVAEMVRFVQILCWIILPVLTLVILLTVFLHYRKKKKNRAEALPAEELLPVPAVLSGSKTPADYIFFDHSGLVHEYRSKLCHSQARYTALRHDFSQLETKFTALAIYASNYTNNAKSKPMENIPVQLNPAMQEEIDQLMKRHKAEKKEWEEKAEQLAGSYRSLEQENTYLQARLELATATEEGKAVLINKWAEENSMLKDRLAEQDYLRDILEEKKSQIIFLQDQLEQRVMQHHTSSQQATQLAAQLEASQKIHQQVSAELAEQKDRVLQSAEIIDRLNSELAGKEEICQQKERLLSEKQELIAQLQQALSEKQQASDLLKNELTVQQDLLASTAEKLSACKLHIRRFYEEFSDSLA